MYPVLHLPAGAWEHPENEVGSLTLRIPTPLFHSIIL